MTFAAPALPSVHRPLTAAAALSLSLLLLVAAAYAPRQAKPSIASTQHIQFLAEEVSGAGADTMDNVVAEINAPAYWSAGYTGAGVDVALIDTGVAPVSGLDGPGKVSYGPDVSSEGGVDALRDLDSFGHGTHMAGIIAGHSQDFRGIAPGARIVSLKVANAYGETNVDRVIAAIRWVTQHAHDGGRNIRVLNLSFGAVPVSSYKKDDLAYAVEQAWKSGIVTVVAAGNGGVNAGGLDDPAFDPYIVAVGADNTHGTTDLTDDNVASFSSRGDGGRDPDVIAPGKSVVSLRVPGSFIDDQHPEAQVGDLYFRGSGTSQSAAVVSGAAALVFSQRPNIRPSQVKALLTQTARPLAAESYAAQGHGLIDMAAVLDAATPDTKQTWPSSTGGTGAWWSLPEATGNSWSSTGNSWSGNSWTGSGWEGPGWDEYNTIAGNSWTTGGWEGVSWGRQPRGSDVHDPRGRGRP